MSPGERFWTSRLRWRLRGAWLWPAFVVLTLLDGALLDLLPPLGAARMDLFLGVLIATFANLFLVGAVAPFLAGRLTARREAALAAPEPGRRDGAPPEAEREVLRDRVGTALLVAGVVAVLVSGLANRPLTVSETEATEQVGRELRSFVARSDSEELRRNLETANTIRLSDGYFRVCIARDDRRRFVCLLIDTDKSPTEVKRDPDARSNSAFAR
ncbi:MAG: hypothetical protein ACR2GL_02230 [Thermoleophilaceae bacterium]